jgi:hypothetical protein
LLADHAVAADNDKMRNENGLRRIECRLLGAALLVWGTIHASAPFSLAAEPAPRAKPPKWSQDVLDAFFDDARGKLDGPRPDYEHLEKTDAAAAGPASMGRDAGTGTGFAWSQLVDAETIETEVKRLAESVAKAVANAGQFKGDGYKECRRDFSELALLFGVAGEYDGQVRWQDVAAGLRDEFARAGRNDKVGSDQSFQEAAQRKQDLDDLVRGSRPQVPAAEKAADWGQVADRPPLMQRMNQAELERLKPWLADDPQFQRHRSDVQHEAQLVATIAEVIGREGFDFWDEEEYAGYRRELRQAAHELATAAADDKYDAARAANVRIIKACADCHADYRG